MPAGQDGRRDTIRTLRRCARDCGRGTFGGLVRTHPRGITHVVPHHSEPGRHRAGPQAGQAPPYRTAGRRLPGLRTARRLDRQPQQDAAGRRARRAPLPPAHRPGPVPLRALADRPGPAAACRVVGPPSVLRGGAAPPHLRRHRQRVRGRGDGRRRPCPHGGHRDHRRAGLARATGAAAAAPAGPGRPACSLRSPWSRRR